MLRSLAEWSGGIPVEHSIMNAWVKAIEEAEHFVYIEVYIHIHNHLTALFHATTAHVEKVY